MVFAFCLQKDGAVSCAQSHATQWSLPRVSPLTGAERGKGGSGRKVGWWIPRLSSVDAFDALGSRNGHLATVQCSAVQCSRCGAVRCGDRTGQDRCPQAEAAACCCCCSRRARGADGTHPSPREWDSGRASRRLWWKATPVEVESRVGERYSIGGRCRFRFSASLRGTRQWDQWQCNETRCVWRATMDGGEGKRRPTLCCLW